MNDIRLIAAIMGTVTLLLEIGYIPGAFGVIGLLFILVLCLVLVLTFRWLQRIDARRGFESDWRLAYSTVYHVQGSW
jgi:hypothetical protein